MSQYSDEPRFTIEQIDLLQRLRRSGMTKPEILQALDTLERLDRQHGHKFPHRPPLPGSAPNANANSSSGNVNAASSSTTSTATQTGYRGNGVLSSPGNSYGGNNNNNSGSPPPPLPVPAPVAMVTAAAAQNGRGGGGEGLAAMTNGKLSPPPQFPVSVVAGGVAASRGYGFEAGEEDMDIEDKVEELMRRDSAIIKEEIKAFLGNRRISQAVVAQVTGISQSRISHWLLQQGSDLSEQKKRAFYRWYHLEKSSPGNTAPTAPPSTPHHPQPHAPAAPQDPSSSSASPRAPPPPPSPPSLHSVQSLFSCSTRSIHY